MIRVMIVEDSMVARELLIRIIEADPNMQVIGIAPDGESAVKTVNVLKPDVIVMDIHMPKMDGIEATRIIMTQNPLPIIIISGSYSSEDSYKSFRAIEAGALMVTKKPVGVNHMDHKKEAYQLQNYIKLMSEIKVIKRIRAVKKTSSSDELNTIKPNLSPQLKIIAIGASTGGPTVIATVLSELKENLPVPIVIVQHMSAGFVNSFASWLSTKTSLQVKIPFDGEQLKRGCVYLAPDHYHLTVTRNRMIKLIDQPPINGLRPAISILFDSIVKNYGRQAMGVLLTGMGSDGALELKHLRDCGGVTVVQSSASCIVDGIPEEAIKMDAAQHILNPQQISQLILKTFEG